MKKAPSELGRLVFSTQQSDPHKKDSSSASAHTFGPNPEVFGEDKLVSCAGLIPVMTLARAGAHRLCV